MCMSKVTGAEVLEAPLTVYKIVYKIGDNKARSEIHPTDSCFVVGETYKAVRVMIGFAGCYDPYMSGYHCFRSVSDARKYSAHDYVAEFKIPAGTEVINGLHDTIMGNNEYRRIPCVVSPVVKFIGFVIDNPIDELKGEDKHGKEEGTEDMY